MVVIPVAKVISYDWVEKTVVQYACGVKAKIAEVELILNQGCK